MRQALFGLALLACLPWTISAAAQNAPVKDIADQAQTIRPDNGAPDATAPSQPPSTKPDLVITPIPMSNPAFGTGLAAAAVMFYNPNGSSQPWISGVGGGYTSTDSWGVGAFHSMSAAKDRLRVMAFAGYGIANLDFYGIGPDAGSAGVSIKLKDKALIGISDVEYKFFTKGFLRHLYLGGRIYYLDLNSTTSIPLPNRPDFTPPEIERDSKISMIGPAFTFDSRDNSTAPRKGVYVTGSMLYGADWLGSDFEHHKLSFAANAYFPLSKTTVLGVRKQLCGVSDNAPYYDLCLFGQQGDLRGYEAGRYRDGASWALQAEIRQHLFGRFGIVGFGGVGGIAEDTSAILKHSTVLGSGGFGIRYLASKSANVNLRADIAWGKDGAAFYFGIGEAF
ncbi:BamA/TamA family outer membrane protein [Sphingobium sp. AP49]|uniref:BamA/TamA family outer membrane protein n=1 Tax=Sphingobium sp. AP49 TaxID=1144307 RepID=UPI00026ECAE0|nr:BamA/TamA family outer membrane protein [Sphingobium sp. AP49]WHO40285.1 BamA/TamA family outer membrane protein [Sphingobium sp. AP49]